MKSLNKSGMHPGQVKHSIIFHVIILLIIFYISTASIFHNRFILFYIGIILLFYQILSKSFQLNKKFILLVVAWLIVNVLATILNDVSFFLPRLVLNTILLLFLPYLLLRMMGRAFWEIFEKWIFRFTLISIPLWMLSNLFIQEFNELQNIFKYTTTSNFLGNTNYWSAVFFTHTNMDNGYGIFRNCGFMWEPGSFALMITWAIIYNWLRSDKMVFNTRIVIYFFALATTFSTAGYFAFFILIMAFLIRRLSFLNIALMIGSALFLYTVIYQLNFISGKIETYSETFAEDPTGEGGYTGRKVNRFQGGVAAVIRTIESPFGYGLVSVNDTKDEDYEYGTNGLASMLEMWGFFLFPILIFLIYKSLKVLNKGHRKTITIWLFFLALMIEFFSNPIHRNLLVYFLIMTPIVFPKQSHQYVPTIKKRQTFNRLPKLV